MKFYLIPAYEETIKNQGYRKIISAAEKKGHEVIVLDLQIKNRLLSEVVDEAVSIIKNDTNSVVCGFSTGALIAYKVSTIVPITKGLFCSISPILGQDIPKNASTFVKYFGKDTVAELRKLEYGTSIAKGSIFFFGDKEGRKLSSRSKRLSELSDGQVVVIKNNEHELNSDYTRELVRFL